MASLKPAAAASAHDAGLTYRPDVDGLRGLAVIAVVWFHSGLPGAPGGFTGVDVFFVISGYLITSIIERDLRQGNFSFGYFYQRRVRRIAPALLTVTATTMVAGYALLLPYRLERFSKSAAAAVAMVSNIYFWRTSNYFTLADRIVPLLHSWSLGVEEQFYLLFPATLVITARLGKAKPAIAVLGIASFLLCLAGTDRDPTAAFYLLPTRGWELMIGAALAVGLVRLPEKLRGTAAIAGIALIGAAAALLSELAPFPGWRALLPTLGAALLIASGPDTPANRALAARPIVYVGRVSYSFYLWHWPILVFLRQVRANPHLPPAVAVAGVAIAFLLSAASYRWIEQPARRRSTPFRRVAVPSIAGAFAILVAVAVAVAGKGLPQRLPADVDEMASFHDSYAPLAHSCTDIGFDAALKRCHIGPAGAPQVLLWGDSHAAANSEAVAVGFGLPGLVISTGSCAPALGWVSKEFRGEGRAECARINRRTLALAVHDPRIETVVLSAYWPAAEREGGSAYWQSAQQLVDRLKQAGKRVMVIAGVPDPGVDVPWASAIRERLGAKPLNLTCSKPRIPLRGVTLVDVSAGFCAKPAYMLFSDTDHPSRYAGLAIIAPAIREVLSEEPRD